MKKIKIIKAYIKYNKQGYNKEQRYFKYAIDGIITFEEYEKFIDKKIMKGG